MKRFIEGEDRQQVTLLPECLDDYIGDDNPVRLVDASSRNSIFTGWASKALIRRRPVDPHITRRSGSSFTSTGTSIASSQAVAWNAKRSATSS